MGQEVAGVSAAGPTALVATRRREALEALAGKSHGLGAVRHGRGG